ncbi:MAG TPA: Mth938-like domain-containing protein [Steroidobacteraceae bacterium]|nr:Mth938-like domain-containing protein [Steroidobacteraceae bacterium]
MRFTQDSTSGINVIRAYGNGELRVNEHVYRGGVILSAATAIADANVQNLDDLLAMDVSGALASEPELVLLGTGARQIFPAPSFGAQFLRAGIGFEVMDTSAACRTFNVLVGEQRRVAAILLL